MTRCHQIPYMESITTLKRYSVHHVEIVCYGLIMHGWPTAGHRLLEQRLWS